MVRYTMKWTVYKSITAIVVMNHKACKDVRLKVCCKISMQAILLK